MTKNRNCGGRPSIGAARQLEVSAVLGRWMQWQNAQGLSQRTILERSRIMTQLAGVVDSKLEAITADDIVRFLSDRNTSRTTKATYFVGVKAYCVWLVRSGIRDDDPTLKVPAPKRPKSVPRPISTEQLMETLKCANRKRTRMMILLAAFAGLRVHEIAKFRGEDIDRYGATLTVNGKGGKTAVLPLHDVLLAECQEWPSFGYWFPNYENDGKPIIPQAVGVAIQRTMERASIHATAHQLRHWYATTLLESGVDVRIVQELLRHESLATTQIYTRVSDKQRRLGLSKLIIPDIPVGHERDRSKVA